jgi:hypothetical protein
MNLLKKYIKHLLEDTQQEIEANIDERIVYHGSSEPGLDHLLSGSPNYEGGIGSGVYVAYDRDVAKFYGKFIYKLKLLLDKNEILWIEPFSLNEYGQDSILMGERVYPFGFIVGNKTYHVVQGSGWVEDDDIEESDETIREREYGIASVIYTLFQGGKVDKLFYSCLAIDGIQDLIKKHIESNNWKLSHTFFSEDSDDVANGYIDIWNEVAYEAAKIKFSEDKIDNVPELKIDEFIDWFLESGSKTIEMAQEIFKKESPKVKVEMISLEQIGEIAKEHGYKGVYLEGVRGGMPDSELLVFSPNDLKMIGEVVQ